MRVREIPGGKLAFLMRRFVLWLVVLVALGVGAGEARRCPEAGAESESEEPAGKPELLGELTREEVEVALPDWVAAEVAAQPDPEAASALAQVPVGGEGHRLPRHLVLRQQAGARSLLAGPG